MSRYDGSNPRKRLEAHPYFTQSGKDRMGKGDQYIANMRDGAVAGFKYFEFRDLQRMGIFIGGTGEGKMQISTTADFSAVYGEIPISVSGEHMDLLMECAIPDGIHPLYFRYVGTGSVDFYGFELE